MGIERINRQIGLRFKEYHIHHLRWGQPLVHRSHRLLYLTNVFGFFGSKFICQAEEAALQRQW